MAVKGIRGAITVEENTVDALKNATVELLNEIFLKNSILKENISHIIFTTTKDLNAAFPAKFARIDMGLNDLAMMCFHEMDVKDSLKMCLRVLVVYNCETNFKPEFVYLKGAKNLRG